MTVCATQPWSAAAFEARYRENADPWHFATSAYERERYRSTLNALIRQTYDSAFEPGCSVGEFTAILSPRCRTVLATDFAPSAVAKARERCRDFPNVEIRCDALTISKFPRGPFDLIIFSEIAYYFNDRCLRELAEHVHEHMCKGGEFVAVHWLGHSADHQLHGDDVHRILAEALQLQWIRGNRYPGFRIDSWTRA